MKRETERSGGAAAGLGSAPGQGHDPQNQDKTL
jgi:hypothetical protein